MLSKKSLKLRDKYFKEIDGLLLRVLKNLQRLHECAMKYGCKLKKRGQNKCICQVGLL